MSRRNLMRSCLAASLLALSGAAAVLVAPAPPAGAADVPCAVNVTLRTTGFDPPTVWAKPGDAGVVCFFRGPGVDTNHTVTLENGQCSQLPNRLCEKSFDDPAYPLKFRFSSEDTYPYFDRTARDQGNDNVRGRIIITNNPPPPASTTTPPPSAGPTTTTTAAPAATTTTTDGSVHPFVITNADPASTTTTTTPPHLTVINTGPPAGKPATGAGGAAAAADASKAKGKAAAGSTTTTTAPPAVPDPSVLDPAALIPAPEATPAPTPDAVTPVEDVTSAAADLLHSDRGADDGTRLLLVALAALGVFLLGGGIFGWYHRSSRYFPA